MKRALLVGVGLLVAGTAVGEAPREFEEKAARVHEQALVVDGHNDVTMWLADFGFDLAMDGAEPGDRVAWPWLAVPWLPGRPDGESVRTHTDLARAARGGLDVQLISIWVSEAFYDPDEPVPGRARARADLLIDVVEEQVRRHPDRLGLARTVADARRLAEEGRLALVLAVEGGHAIEDDLANLRHYHDRGVRSMTLTWSFSHGWADASGDPRTAAERRHGGMTDFGRQVVAEMNDLGMVVDVSHGSDETFWQALAVTRAPVIASHSSVRALCDHPRNLSNDMLRALHDNGGVAMINFSAMYLDPERRTPGRIALHWLRHLGRSVTPLSALVDHVEHAVRVAGVDHVGIGSDFDGVPFLPEGMQGVEDLPALTRELLYRGHSEEDVRKILGGNVLRVFEAAERLARAGEPSG